MSKKEGFGTKFADILKNFRVILLIFFIFISYVAVFGFRLPFSNDGVVIGGVILGSGAEKAGLEFNPEASFLSYEKILYLDNTQINEISDYTDFISNLDINSSFKLKTDKNTYSITLTSQGNKSNLELVGINVKEAYASNIKLGIELVGGSRLLLTPVDEVTQDEFDLIVDTMQSRLNIYGASGTKVSKIESGLSDEKLILIESLDSNKYEVFELISTQGEFLATVGNVSVFTGDNVLKVFSDPQRAGLQSCQGNDNDGYMCTYAFSIEIDSAGADALFQETSQLDVVGGKYLSEKLYFYLDGTEITALNIASSFKYNKITTPQITVSSELMPTKAKAIEDGGKEMKMLQTILSTKALPSELEVVQSYSISSSLGSQLLKNSLLVGFAALLLVSSIVALRYRYFGIFVGIFIALVSELIIVFGFAAFMKFSIDLAAIGGLIAAIGTGVDDQIIITDEYFRDKNKYVSSRKKIKGAFYIIMIAYLTTLAAMSPFLFSPSLSLIKGFAFMIIVGITIGVFITRPAYAAMLRIMMTTRKRREEEDKEEE